MSPCRPFRTLVAGTAVIVAGLLIAVPQGAGAGPEDERDREKQAEHEPNLKLRRESDGKVVRSDAEWRKLLTREQFRVTRRKGTERPFTGGYWKTKQDGVYQCVCCGQPLFDSRVKFDSGTGWPSFREPIDKRAVIYREDRSEREVRMEVLCSRCDAHLGHVFGDGPRPGGHRYCMNSVALKRVARDTPAATDSKAKELHEQKRP